MLLIETIVALCADYICHYQLFLFEITRFQYEIVFLSVLFNNGTHLIVNICFKLISSFDLYFTAQLLCLLLNLCPMMKTTETVRCEIFI